jgi:hypothetical protein
LTCVNLRNENVSPPNLCREVALQDDQMVGFIRFGNDFTQNFYQIEIPQNNDCTTSSANCTPQSADLLA